MSTATKYVGLDVHQATTVAAVRQANGRLIARTVVPTEASAVLALVRGMRGAVHVTFEEGTQAQCAAESVVPRARDPHGGSWRLSSDQRREWLAQLPEVGVRLRASVLFAELETLQRLRPTVKTALFAEAKRDPAWRVLRTIPYLGPVRVALLLATLQTPWRFRTKRHLWAYAGLAVRVFTALARHQSSDAFIPYL